MFHYLVIILTVIIAILLIGIVLIQKSKGGGLSSQFGNASAQMGVHQTNTFLERGTWWLAGLIVVLSIVSAYTIPKAGYEIKTEVQETALPGANTYEQNIPDMSLDTAVPAATAESPVDE